MTANDNNSTIALPGGREMVAIRIFDAPRELVWKVWTDPKHIAQWWGPNGFTNTIHKMDVRPGGDWDFIMHGPDGRDYKNKNVFVEVIPPECLSYEHASFPKHHVKVTFEAQDGKTKLTMRMTFDSAEERDDCIKTFGAFEGLKQTLGRLEEKLAAMGNNATTVKPHVITRVFDAPRELVFKAWTERERLMQWFGPKGFTLQVAKMDLRPGGIFHYSMLAPNGQEMWGKFVYREIVAPERIVLINSFSDKDGNITRHPMSPTWPLEMLSTTTLTESNGKTLLTLEWEPWNATEEELQTFDKARPGMDQGWSGTFEQLDNYLAKAKS